MSDPKDDRADVPDEVKRVLAHLKPEPESAAEERERLLSELEPLIASSTGPLQKLLECMRTVLQSTRPGAPFQPRFAREFTAALDRFRKDPAASKSPPEVLLDCLIFLRELVEARGVGGLLEAVDEVSLEPSNPLAKARQQQDLKTRIKLGNTRG
jgi:hypothetical protein